MIIKVNGKEENLSQNFTVLEYLEHKGINPKAVVVEYNYEVPDKALWDSIVLKENDNLEIVKFIGGG